MSIATLAAPFLRRHDVLVAERRSAFGDERDSRLAARELAEGVLRIRPHA
jgi:hypothetical protein